MVVYLECYFDDVHILFGMHLFQLLFCGFLMGLLVQRMALC